MTLPTFLQLKPLKDLLIELPIFLKISPDVHILETSLILPDGNFASSPLNPNNLFIELIGFWNSRDNPLFFGRFNRWERSLALKVVCAYPGFFKDETLLIFQFLIRFFRFSGLMSILDRGMWRGWDKSRVFPAPKFIFCIDLMFLCADVFFGSLSKKRMLETIWRRLIGSSESGVAFVKLDFAWMKICLGFYWIWFQPDIF